MLLYKHDSFKGVCVVPKALVVVKMPCDPCFIGMKNRGYGSNYLLRSSMVFIIFFESLEGRGFIRVENGFHERGKSGNVLVLLMLYL